MRVKQLWVLIAAITLLSSLCSAADFSFTGTFSNVNQVQYFTFQVSAGEKVVIQSYSYGGGSNTAGASIAAGGFDPITAIFKGTGNSATLVKTNDDDFGCTHVAKDAVTGLCYDVYWEATSQLADPTGTIVAFEPGTYIVALTNYGNLTNGMTLGDGFTNAGSGINCESYPRTISGTFQDCRGNSRDGHWALDIKGVDIAVTGTQLPGVLTVTSPNGGESWVAGSTHSITWTSTNVAANVNVALLKAGVGYKSLATNVPVANGSLTVTLPANLPLGNDYSVRVMTVDLATRDISNAPFSVTAPVTVLAPNGGETLIAGSTQTITWNAPGVSGSVNIALLKAGSGYLSIATNVPAANGSFGWTLPRTLPVGSDYTIRVMNASNGSMLDVSDAPFSIAVPAPSSVTVVSPNGGETWKLGSSQTITWNVSGQTANVNIALMKAGLGYKSIATNVPASQGTLTWTVPASMPVGSDYTIRVLTTDGALVDFSNATFSITQ